MEALCVTWREKGHVMVTVKARVAKQRLKMPRLELFAGQMAVNSVDNVRRALDGFAVNAIHCLLDSTVALHWIRSGREYQQFVAYHLRKI